MNPTSEPATRKQLDYMAGLGIPIPPNCTKKQATELLLLAKSREPATERQLDFLRVIGVEYPQGCTKSEASRLIEHAKAVHAAEEVELDAAIRHELAMRDVARPRQPTARQQPKKKGGCLRVLLLILFIILAFVVFVNTR